MEQKPVLSEVKDRVAYITLNRPDALNAISYGMMKMLEETILDLDTRKDVSVVVLKGAGKAFCAGADLKFLLSAVENNRPDDIERFIDQITLAFNSLEDCPKPVVAVVHDYALAGGFEMIQACDIIIVSDGARLGDQHSNFWIIPGGGGTQRLGAILGPVRAKELLFTGRWLTGKEAAKIGLASRSVPLDELDSTLDDVLERLSNKPPSTFQAMKQLVDFNFKSEIRKGLELEKAMFMQYILSPPALEGLKAFSGKRKPQLGNIGL